jgi:hypothetical protein
MTLTGSKIYTESPTTMDELKKPSVAVAVLFTILAACGMITFVLMATGSKTGEALIIFQLFTIGLLLFSAIASWVVYFTRYVKFEVENQLRKENKE